MCNHKPGLDTVQAVQACAIKCHGVSLSAEWFQHSQPVSTLHSYNKPNFFLQAHWYRLANTIFSAPFGSLQPWAIGAFIDIRLTVFLSQDSVYLASVAINTRPRDPSLMWQQLILLTVPWQCPALHNLKVGPSSLTFFYCLTGTTPTGHNCETLWGHFIFLRIQWLHSHMFSPALTHTGCQSVIWAISSVLAIIKIIQSESNQGPQYLPVPHAAFMDILQSDSPRWAAAQPSAFH